MDNIEILVSTMHQKNSVELIEKMKIKDKCVIINQIPDENEILPEDEINENMKFLSYHEKGLSKSRNKAINNSSEDICVIADDDMYYEEDVKQKILKAYQKYKDADLIAFYVDNEDDKKRRRIPEEGEVNFFKSMKITSVQVTFKKQSIKDKKIEFKEQFRSWSKILFWRGKYFFIRMPKKRIKNILCTGKNCYIN